MKRSSFSWWKNGPFYVFFLAHQWASGLVIRRIDYLQRIMVIHSTGWFNPNIRSLPAIDIAFKGQNDRPPDDFLKKTACNQFPRGLANVSSALN
jgi:hypothetical protein